MAGKSAIFLACAAIFILAAGFFLLQPSTGAKNSHNIVSLESDSEIVVLAGAGDIASCESNGDELTAKLLDGIAGTVFTLGDNVYEDGTDADFNRCFAPTWGRHIGRIMPVVGNHEYRTPGAGGYYRFFGGNAGDPTKGYYSYNIGKWHVVVLNSNCDNVECFEGSAQEKWLREDLAMSQTQCTVAMMHHPRWSSVQSGNKDFLQPLWKALYDANVDLYLAGHDHSYERLAPLGLYGELEEKGIRVIIAGTGGVNTREFKGPALSATEARNDKTFGVLKLTLHPASYDWEFVPVEGGSFTDSGTGECH